MRIRQIVRSVVGVVLLFATTVASAQLEFHRAYRGVRPDSVPASFPNDGGSFPFMSRRPLIAAKDILGATTDYRDGMGSVVEIAISAEALKKINELAASNAAAIDRGAFDNVIGLAAVVDGEPMSVIQGVHEQLPTPVIPWVLGNFQLPREDAMGEAEAWAERIKQGIEPLSR